VAHGRRMDQNASPHPIAPPPATPPRAAVPQNDGGRPPSTPRRARTAPWRSAAIAVGVTALLAGCAAAATSTGSGPATVPATATTAPGTSPATSPGTTSVTPTSAAAPTAGAYPSAITATPVVNPAFAPLGRDVQRRVSQAGLPGASLLVLHDGKLVEQEAWGSYDLSTKVPIASASKWFSGVVIMSLVDEGKIDLDAPISTYLPEATGPSGRITMRQLVSFTSGLEYDEKIPCYNDPSITLAACNSQILSLPLLGAPGTGYRYTGTHLHVAAGVAQAVTGQEWEDLFQARVAGPLGMTSTTFVSPLRAAASPDGHPLPAGSGISTLGDYGRFLEMLVHDGVAPDGTRILSSEAVAEMSVDQTGDAKFMSAASYRKADETPYGVAHWLDASTPDGTILLESSPGKFGFRPWIDHVNGVAGVYLVVDQDDSHVADSPDRAPGAADVQTSGEFVITGTAEAVGGRSPMAGAARR
jgi:CubicO group peptidase (beta-lactamase class C family)